MNRIFKIIILLTMFSSTAQAQENPYGTEAINHLGLAVSKLDESVAFFVDVLGWEQAGGQPDYPAVFVSNGPIFLTLWQVENPKTATPFNRRGNVGLHHLAITVGSLEQLNALHEKLKTQDNVNIEFAPEHLGEGPTTHMMINEPSGNRLEFIVPASRIN